MTIHTFKNEHSVHLLSKPSHLHLMDSAVSRHQSSGENSTNMALKFCERVDRRLKQTKEKESNNNMRKKQTNHWQPLVIRLINETRALGAGLDAKSDQE